VDSRIVVLRQEANRLRLGIAKITLSSVGYENPVPRAIDGIELAVQGSTRELPSQYQGHCHRNVSRAGEHEPLVRECGDG
jgi:hypothetical protein